MGRDGGGSRANVRNEGVGRERDLLISSCAASAKRGAGEEKKDEKKNGAGEGVAVATVMMEQGAAKRGGVSARNARTRDPSNFSPRGPRHIGRCLKFVSRDGEERRRTTPSL